MKVTHKEYAGKVSKNYKQYLEQAKKQFMEHNEDYMHVNFGYEGSGKSTLLLNTVNIIDPDFNVLKQTPYTQEQFTKTIDQNNPGQAVLVDEGAEFFYRRDAMKTENRTAIKKLKKCREQNQAILTNLPQPQDLDKAIWPRVQAVTFCYRRPKGHFLLWCGKKTIAEIKQLALQHNSMTEIKKEVKPDAKLRFKKIPENTQLWKDYLAIKAEGITDHEEEDEEQEKTMKEIIKEIKEHPNKIKKLIREYRGRILIDKDLLRHDYDLSLRKTKSIKKVLERDVDLEQYHDQI